MATLEDVKEPQSKRFQGCHKTHLVEKSSRQVVPPMEVSQFAPEKFNRSERLATILFSGANCHINLGGVGILKSSIFADETVQDAGR